MPLKTTDPVKRIAQLQKQVDSSAKGLRSVLAYADREGIAINPRLRAVVEAVLDGELAARGLLVEQYDPKTGKRRRWERKSPPNRKGKLSRPVLCGAKTQRGTLCQALPVPGKKRCRWHGGKSTGPKTPEGKAAIAASNRRRALKLP